MPHQKQFNTISGATLQNLANNSKGLAHYNNQSIS